MFSTHENIQFTIKYLMILFQCFMIELVKICEIMRTISLMVEYAFNFR